MALFGFPNLKIELDVSSGGALGDISAYVTSIGAWTKEALVEELTAAGDTTDRWAAIGFTQKSEITLEGPYDDVAAKLVAIGKANLGNTLTLQLTFDLGTASDVETCECIVSKVERLAAVKKLTQFKITLRPTGAVT